MSPSSPVNRSANQRCSLAAVAPAECHPEQMRRQVIGQPIGMLADDLGAIRADLLRQLAQHSRARVLVRIDAALRQLPAAGCAFRVRQIGAPGNQNQAIPVEHRRADIPTIRQHRIAHFVPPAPGGGCASALTGASASPSAASPPAQAAMRSVVTGRTVLTSPRALPFSRAKRASSASLASIWTAPGRFVDHEVDGRVPTPSAGRGPGSGIDIEQSALGQFGQDRVIWSGTRQTAPRASCRARRWFRHIPPSETVPIPTARGSLRRWVGHDCARPGIVQRKSLRLHRSDSRYSCSVSRATVNSFSV